MNPSFKYGFFTSSYFLSSDWSYDSTNKYYYHKINDKNNDKYLQDFLDVTAPLLLNSIYKSGNFFTLDKLVVKEENDCLKLQILIDSTNNGTTINNTTVLSEARIYPNINQFDEEELAELEKNKVLFDFGDKGAAAHDDGSALSSSKTYTSGDKTLKLTGMSKVYGGAYDAKGNSCLKIGTSSAIGQFSFTVDNDINKVIIYVAQYKANTTKISVNNKSYTITNSSNNGAYTPIEIDTTTTKTISFTTVSGGGRCMIDAIELYK